MIDFIIDILWLSSALSVFSCIVLFILSPMYNFWMVSKNDIDTESELYISVLKAVEEADGESIEVQLVIGGVKD
tara:strand:- start:554 stop:775 length:222 start_codon:yes stop_codon:yes gene_type:complete